MAFYCIHCRSEIDPKYKACPFCGEPITDFLRRYLEQPIDGKYQILARLGVGGMGEVYKVLHVHLNAIRVIKLMRSNIATDPGAHDRFLREARLATRIQHPHVAVLYDFSTLEDGSRYMVWEYIEGTNLHELLEERGPLSPRYAAKLAAQALHGLDAIHRAGIVHRDISPENLMITRDAEGEEHVKIIDLGIAKQSGDEGDTKTKTGMFVGKWKYCSPEQLGMLGEGERIDGRADIYSFGIVLYEMLTGVPPFQADTPHGYLVLHASEKPKPLREVNPSVPASPELEALIFRAMEKDRRNRFEHARDFASALERLLPSLAEKPGARAVTVSTEPTEEPTRVVAKAQSDAPTLVTKAHEADTVEVRPAQPTQPMLVTTVETVSEELAKIGHGLRRKGAMWLGIAATTALLAIVGATMMRKNEPAASSTAPTAASVIPAMQGHLGIHAYPWANVTSIRNVDNGEPIALKGPLVTPTPIDLAPGKYEVTLSNPAFDKPITRSVEVRAGEDQLLNIAFSDAAKAQLPNFGGKSR